MRTHGLTRAFLMDESEARIVGLAREGSTPQALIARRMIEEPYLYRHWEAEHARLMRSVAEARAQEQVAALRSTCFGLIHRKAMFEYLRAQKITGRNRHAVFELIFGDQDYARAVVTEHGNYVRSISSLACSHHLGLALLEDRAFGDPMSRYEARYADYFRAFCDSALTSNRYNSDDTLSTLLPYLKRQLGILRRAITAMPRQPPDVSSLNKLDIRPSAANSQRMSAPFQSGVTAA
jgi:hypothetical protein